MADEPKLNDVCPKDAFESDSVVSFRRVVT